MSLSKKDPSLRVAANDPHLVSLGGGRLSTAVTIHNIPVGDCTIGSSLQCSVSISGAGVKPVHCTIYRSEENQVSLVPERNARILIDNEFISKEVDLRQGAMITIGDSYYLRYNNPAEALQMRCAMEDTSENQFHLHKDCFYEHDLVPTPRYSDKSSYSYYDNIKSADSSLGLIGWQCPKVFSSDLVTVNMSAKDVLGQKYANFAKNLAEHHHKDKNLSYVLKNNANGNNSLSSNREFVNKGNYTSSDLKSNDSDNVTIESKLSHEDHLEDMLKMCAEYTDRQDRSYGANTSSNTSSPIIQNRIKTNGSLPREKKSPFHQELQSSFGSNNSLIQSRKLSGYENVKSLQKYKVEFVSPCMDARNENIKLAPQSPRTKIRTICTSPIKDCANNQDHKNSGKSDKNYEDLIKNFEGHIAKQMKSVEKSSISKKSLSKDFSPVATKTTNINNVISDAITYGFPFNSTTALKKPAPVPRKINKNAVDSGIPSNFLCSKISNEKLQIDRRMLLQRIQSLKAELSSLQMQDNETLIEIDVEHALIMVEIQSREKIKQSLQNEYQILQEKAHRLEAQRNATRVMEENQQSKLKHCIEMKQDQVRKLKELLKQKTDNTCLREELLNVQESLENDRKYFEDLEFQYLEGEAEWQSYRDDLNLEEQIFNKKIEECQLSIISLEKLVRNCYSNVSTKHQRVSNYLISLIKELQQCEEQFKFLQKKLSPKINSISYLSEQQDDKRPSSNRFSDSHITQSLFGSTEILCPRSNNEDLMSKSVNENMFYNNKIEFLNNELTDNNGKIYVGKVDLKEDTSKLCTSMKKIERQSQLLTSQQGLLNLDYEKRKIEELLKKLNSDVNQQSTATTERTYGSIENSIPTKLSLEQSMQKCSSPIIASSNSTSSNLTYEKSDKCSPKVINKIMNELSLSSPDETKTYSIVDKRGSSVLSNELSSQRDNEFIPYDRKNAQQQKQQRPLTRYLPIFAEDLDLRYHIESAGHPISLCPYVFLDAYSCRGYLHKLGSTFHTWSKRWFVLDRRRSALIYYAEKSERKPRGGAYFSSIDEVYMDHLNVSKTSRTHSTFIVKTKRRSYYLQASSDTAARIWIDAIITGAQGNVDY